MKSVAEYAAEASRLADAAARISSEQEVVRDDGTRVPSNDPTAYRERAFECLALAIGQLANAVAALSRKL